MNTSTQTTPFIITEKETLQSTREGDRIEATNLTAAKRYAARNQFFERTVLTISDEGGNLLSYREDGGRWKNA